MKLDLEQETAANCLKKHSIIIAGAGSGKTTTLLAKVEKLIKSGIEPNKILVISFTNETVNNFRKKCLYNIDVFTFHKIAMIFSKNDKEIIDDELLLDEIIYKYLNSINKSIKKKLYRYYKGMFSMFSEKKYIKFIYENKYNSIKKDIISIIKSSKCNSINIMKTNINKFKKTEKIIMYIIVKIIDSYNRELKLNNFCDFDDLIIDATNKLRSKEVFCKYEHIMVDEYQDISKIRLDFLIELVKNSNAYLTVVGDDFQSIYGFSGSSINLFYDFKNYFDNVETFFITTTYRCPQELINKAGNFIMKNPLQIKKNLKSINLKANTIHKVYVNNCRKIFRKYIDKLIKKNKSVLILSRNNYDIKRYIDNDITFNNSFLEYKNIIYKNIRFMSMHSAKGLEADVVVLLNLSNNLDGIPCRKRSNLLAKVFNKDEKFKHAEERRLFYVALTRCKEEIYLFIDINNPSLFIKEI